MRQANVRIEGPPLGISIPVKTEIDGLLNDCEPSLHLKAEPGMGQDDTQQNRRESEMLSNFLQRSHYLLYLRKRPSSANCRKTVGTDLLNRAKRQTQAAILLHLIRRAN